MEVIGTVVSLVAGLFGGAAGGVLTAGLITRRSELAGQRLADERALRELVKRYRATIVFDHDQVYEVSKFSKEYGSVGGQEDFAVAVLGRLESQRARTERVLRSEVLSLVGDLRFELAEQRTSLPVERLDPVRESKRQTLALYQILNAGEERVDGLLPGVLASQNDPARHQKHYTAALESLDRMLEALGGRRLAR